MATIPFVTIQLDKERHMRLSMGAMVDFEQEFDKKITSIQEDGSITTYMQLAYIMLKQEDESLTLKSSTKLFDDNMTTTEAFNVIGKAIETAFPPVKNAEKPTAKNE